MFKKLIFTPLLNFTIKTKLNFSFVALMLVVVIGSGLFIHQGYEQKEVVSQVFMESTPIINHLQHIHSGLTELSAMSGLYLLTREMEYKNNYHEALKTIGTHLSALEGKKDSHSELVQSLAVVKEKLQQLDKSFINVMAIGTNDSLNQPALKLAAEEIGPLFNQVLQITSSMINSEDDAEEFSPLRQKILKTIYEIRVQWLNISRNITVYLTYRGKLFAEEFPYQLTQLNEKLNLLSQLQDDLTFEQATGLEELLGVYVAYRKAVELLVPLHYSDGWRKDSQLIRNELGPLLKAIQHDVDTIVTKEQERVAFEIENLLADNERFTRKTIVLAAIGVLFTIGLMILLKLLVSQRLTSTQKAMHEISSGGGLGHSLDETGKDELSEVAADFNLFVSKIKRVVDLVIFSSSNLASEANKMSTITECALDLSNSQETKVSEVSTINSEMSDQVAAIATNAGEAAKSIEEAKSVAENGRDIVKQATESVQKIASEVDNSTVVVKQLAEETHSISTVIEVIQSISEQTNLLALNAAIEAARAGESGRGFAVVADEVRSLSHKIQDETITIKDKIEHLQEAANSVVQKMASMQEDTEITVDLSSQTGNAFDDIVRDITTVTAMNLQNAEATEQQRKNNEKVNASLTQLTIMSQTMAKTSQDAFSSGNEFKIMSEQLKDIVQQFIHTPTNEEPSVASLDTDETKAKSDNRPSHDSSEVELF